MICLIKNRRFIMSHPRFDQLSVSDRRHIERFSAQIKLFSTGSMLFEIAFDFG